MPDQNEHEPMSGRAITGSWRDLLDGENDGYVDEWRNKADDLYRDHGGNLFPNRDNVFRAFSECPLDRLKVVILGEQPYNSAHADGLAFSTSRMGPVPPSLWIIFSKIFRDTCPNVSHTNGNLRRWAQQGVLLLNSWLTIGQNRGSIRWGDFTGHVIDRISERYIYSIVFMLLGGKAIARSGRIINANNRHLILQSSHPSPRGAFCDIQRGVTAFADCRHFSRANDFLRRNRAVNWR